MAKLTFPEGFLWGSATSAHQVEGNNKNSDWWQWENSKARTEALRKRNKNPEDYKSGKATDSYVRYEEDFDIAKNLNQNSHRFSIEWSRIEPEQGSFDQEQIEHYRKVLLALKERNMKTVVTLHHFTNPVWFADMGGWTKKENIAFFVRYAEKVISELGDLIDILCIFNEMNLYASLSYFGAKWPPQEKSFMKYIDVEDNLLHAHKEVYAWVKKQKYSFPTGSTQNLMYLEGKGLGKIFTPFIRFFYYDRTLPEISKHSDYIAFNYYTRALFAPKRTTEKDTSDFNWEIYPKGIYFLLKEIGRYNLPTYIFENGIADARDAKRAEYIKEHLIWIHKAISEGVDVRGYMHWSLLDNFEWAEGFEMKFGLVEVERNTSLKRNIRQSAYYYAQICKDNYIETNE